MRFYTLLFTLAVSIPTLSFADVHKWVDDKGHVHFSQSAPSATQKLTQKTIKIMKSSLGLSIVPEKKMRGIYCGSIKLNDYSADEKSITQDIKHGIREWREEENIARKKYIDAKKTKNKKIIEKTKTQLAEHSCRTKWARVTLKNVTSITYIISKRITVLQDELDVLKKEQDETCPMDAKFYGKHTLVGKEARKVMKCYNGYEDQIKILNKKIKSNKSRLSSAKRN